MGKPERTSGSRRIFPDQLRSHRHVRILLRQYRISCTTDLCNADRKRRNRFYHFLQYEFLGKLTFLSARIPYFFRWNLQKHSCIHTDDIRDTIGNNGSYGTTGRNSYLPFSFHDRFPFKKIKQRRSSSHKCLYKNERLCSLSYIFYISFPILSIGTRKINRQIFKKGVDKKR